MRNVVQYLNSLITTINPNLDAPVSDHHPCQKHPKKLHDNLQDYIELVNKLQWHTQCNFAYCLHVDHVNQQYCRFEYLKEITENTYLHDNNGKPELITARNDLFINSHDRL